MGDSYSKTDEGKQQTPLPPAMKRQHGSSDDETKSPSKKPKVDVSTLYDPGAGNKEENEGGDAPTGKDKSGESKPKKAKKSKMKHKKNKKHGKDKDKDKEKRENQRRQKEV